jgi:hypothetical protein
VLIEVGGEWSLEIVAVFETCWRTDNVEGCGPIRTATYTIERRETLAAVITYG